MTLIAALLLLVGRLLLLVGQAVVALTLLLLAFGLAAAWVLMRIALSLAPYLLRAACVLCAVGSLYRLALTTFAAFAFEPGWLAGIVAAQMVGALLALGLPVFAAVRTEKNSLWGVCLFIALVAWAASLTIENIDARALPLISVALAVVTNPLIGANTMNNYQTIGEMMDENAHSGWSQLAAWGGFLIYLGGIVYVTAHNANLFSSTLPPALQVWAYVTVGILALNAIALPIGIHFHFAPGGQREWATVMYALDLLVAAANAVVDSIVNRGGKPEGMEAFYYQYVVVGAPILFGLIAWAVIWLLDPAQKMRDAVAHARASTVKVLVQRIAQEAKADVESNEAVTAAARQIGRDVARAVTGQALKPSPNGHGPRAMEDPQGGGMTAKAVEVAALPKPSRSGRKSNVTNMEAEDPNA